MVEQARFLGRRIAVPDQIGLLGKALHPLHLKTVLTSPSGGGAHLLIPALDSWMQRQPDLHLDLQVEGQPEYSKGTQPPCSTPSAPNGKLTSL
jgi:DNA-binding transcriptional LysR family regulator